MRVMRDMRAFGRREWLRGVRHCQLRQQGVICCVCGCALSEFSIALGMRARSVACHDRRGVECVTHLARMSAAFVVASIVIHFPTLLECTKHHTESTHFKWHTAPDPQLLCFESVHGVMLSLADRGS